MRVRKATAASGDFSTDYSALADMCEVPITVRTTKTDQDTGDGPGNYEYFVLLGREKVNSSWKVLEIGTGP